MERSRTICDLRLYRSNPRLNAVARPRGGRSQRGVKPRLKTAPRRRSGIGHQLRLRTKVVHKVRKLSGSRIKSSGGGAAITIAVLRPRIMWSPGRSRREPWRRSMRRGPTWSANRRRRSRARIQVRSRGTKTPLGVGGGWRGACEAEEGGGAQPRPAEARTSLPS